MVPLVGACSGNAGEAIKSSLSGGSLPTRPSTEAPTTEAPTTEEPTTEAPTTEEPTTEAPTTEEPTTEAPTTEEPTTEEPTTEPTEVQSPTPAEADSGGVSPWIWVALAAAVLLVIVLVAMASSSRKKRGAWENQARQAYAAGVALHDRIAADLVAGDPAVFGPERIGEVTRLIDRASEQFRGIWLTVPDGPDGPKSRSLADVNRDLDALRSAVEVEARAASSGTAPAAAASATLQVRLDDFERSLRGFRAAAWPGQS